MACNGTARGRGAANGIGGGGLAAGGAANSVVAIAAACIADVIAAFIAAVAMYSASCVANGVRSEPS